MGMCDFQTKIKVSKQTMSEIKQRFFENKELSFKKIIPNTTHVFWEFEFTDDTITYRSLDVATSVFKALSKEFPTEEIVIELSTRNVYASISSETLIFKDGELIAVNSIPNPEIEEDLEKEKKYEILKIAKMSFEQYNSLFTNETTDFSNYTHDDFDKWKQRGEVEEWFNGYWDHSTEDILDVFDNVNNNYALIIDKNGVVRLHELPIDLTKEHELTEEDIELQNEDQDMEK